MTHLIHKSCIELFFRCAQECENFADACLHEYDVAMMSKCIRLDNDCAEICWSAAAFMSRGSKFIPEICRLCAELCEACGAECAKHKAPHCQLCATACQECAAECRQMAEAAV
jgi:hypothetical protein